MASSITINGLAPVTLHRLEVEARRKGVDVATVARDVLRRGAPPAEPQAQPSAPEAQQHHDLDHLAGTWTEVDADAFAAAAEPFARIDPEIWK